MRGKLEIPTSHVTCVAFRSTYDIAAYARLVGIVRQMRPRAVITHLWFANTVGRIAAFLARVPIVCSYEHNIYDTVKARRQFGVDRILQHVSTHIVAVSQAAKESLARHGIRPSKISVVHNGIDTKSYEFSPKKRASMRNSLGVDADQYIFLFVGRLIRQKGVDVLLEAFQGTSTGVLYIVGEGDDRKMLEHRAEALGLSDRVRFLGTRDDIPALMSAADCFVLPSRWEGLGTVLLEARMSGLRIITSDLPAAREVFAGSSDAVLVPAEDPDALKKAMVNASSHASSRLAVSAEKERYFSISRNVDALQTLLG